MSTARILLDGRAVAREEVLQRGQRAASGLHEIGVREGDTIALLLRNDFAFFEAQTAAASVGAYCVPINWHGRTEEVRYVLDDARPKVLVAHADLLAPLRGQLPAGMRVLVVPTPAEVSRRYGIAPADAAPQAGDTVWPDWLAGFAPWDGPAMRARASMIYTSGTTGHPKGVKRDPATPEQTAAYAAMLERVYGITPDSRCLVPGPLYHASPNAYGRYALPRAELIVLQSKFDPEEMLAAIEQHRITNAVMVPTMFVRLLKLPKEVRERYDVSSVRWVTHTGAPCPAEIKREFMA